MEYQEDVIRRAKVFAALGDRVRLRIAESLAKTREMTGTEITRQVGISMALLCHHSRILVDAGVVRKRKKGQTTYASLDRSTVRRALKKLL
jgi:DNA-binding transcriptional ArsR family regulator